MSRLVTGKAAPPPQSPEPVSWTTLHGVLVLVVMGFFLVSVKTILNPFVLFFLLLFLLSPYSGTRHHALAVSAMGVLTLVWLLNTTGFLLAPFVLALVLAYIQHPLVSRLQGRRVSRSMAVMLLALPGVVVITLVMLVGIPALSAQLAEFIQGIPGLIRGATERVERLQSTLATRDVPLLDEQALLERLRAVQPETVTAWLQERQTAIARNVWQGVLGVGRGLGTVLSILGYVFLTPILTFYLLRDWAAIERKIGELVPAGHRERVTAFGREYDRLLSRYLRGQVLAAGIVGVLTWLGFLVLGFPYALLLGVVAGVFNVIPYMGLVASLIPALAIAIFSPNPLLALAKIAAVFVVVQMLDQAVIGPKVVGESVGLHPVWVMLALAVCGFFFGFVGLLIAVPLAVLVKLVLVAALARYRSSGLFRGERPLSARD